MRKILWLIKKWLYPVYGLMKPQQEFYFRKAFLDFNFDPTTPECIYREWKSEYGGEIKYWYFLASDILSRDPEDKDKFQGYDIIVAETKIGLTYSFANENLKISDLRLLSICQSSLFCDHWYKDWNSFAENFRMILACAKEKWQIKENDI